MEIGILLERARAFGWKMASTGLLGRDSNVGSCQVSRADMTKKLYSSAEPLSR